jgi:hypothetical protein
MLLIVPALVGALVALSIGVYGGLHTPTGVAVNLAGFSSGTTVKVWLASAAMLFGMIQLLSALAMWGRLPGVKNAPPWASILHRWSGRIAFLIVVPVAVQCVYALGFQHYDTRVLIHSLAGCLFFGLFTTKMLSLPKRGLSGWVLPVLGGLTFTALIGLWLTSSLWFFTTVGVQF